MDRIDELLNAYREAFARGETDPEPFLTQVEGVERQELDGLIDEYLLTAQRIAFDAKAYKGSRAERVVENASSQLGIETGGWPILLPSLRKRWKLKRSVVVANLADALGAKDSREMAEVGDFYHAMEYGTLPPDGVSSVVLNALEQIYRLKTGMLRKAGSAFEGVPGLDTGLIHTRQSSDVAFKWPSEGQASPGMAVHSMEDADFDASSGPSRIEKLFTEGDSPE